MARNFNLCLIVDSNLKDIHVGQGKPDLSVYPDRPMIKVKGDVYCPYTVSPQNPSWPKLAQLKAQQYTDIVVTVGINHCKPNYSGRYIEGHISAACRLSELFLMYSRELPGVRLYFIDTPPSLNLDTSRNVQQFNAAVRQTSGVVFIDMPPSIFCERRLLLLPTYAREREVPPSFPSHKKLHLNATAKKYVVQRLIMKLQQHSKKNIRSFNKSTLNTAQP